MRGPADIAPDQHVVDHDPDDCWVVGVAVDRKRRKQNLLLEPEMLLLLSVPVSWENPDGSP